jgi:hypothetical protein
VDKGTGGQVDGGDTGGKGPDVFSLPR